VARSRKDYWLRDEVILALDLYRREGRNPSSSAVAELSEQLRSIPIEAHCAGDPRFRNRSGVSMKVSNFVALDPNAETAGMSRGSRRDAEVFQEYWTDSERLEATANTIRANLTTLAPADAEDVVDAPEGRILTRAHRVRERSAKLRRKKLVLALEEFGKLECEVCGFDFATVYGKRGKGFMECHHTIPLRDLKPGVRTRLEDLALLCANCHRMIHVGSPWLTLSQLRGHLRLAHEGAS
jgi:5-methylcytosine-specific restriction enzyme A